MRKLFFALCFFFGCSTIFSGIALSAGTNRMEFNKKIVVDGKGFGYEALRLLAPKTWRFAGGISWNFSKVPPEACTSFTITSPDKRSVFKQFPHMNMFWSQDSNLKYSYSNNGFNVVQPMKALDFLKNYFLPRYRSKASSLTIKHSELLQDLAKQTNELTQYQMNIFSRISPFTFPFELQADAAHIQVEYAMDGVRIVEDLTVSISYMIAYFPNIYGGSIGATTWIPTVTSFKAPKKAMNDHVKVFKIIADSRKDNPKWMEDYVKLSATITRDQLCQQRAIFNRMKQISRSQSEMGDMIMDSYQKRNAAYDRIYDNYSEAIRGVDTYRDPINNWEVELPTGYGRAWTNGSEYIFSDDANYNPNIGSTQDWQQMQRNR